MDAIDSHITEAGLSAAYLDVLTFAFIAFQRDTGQSPNRIRDVGIGQARDYLRG